MKNNGVDRLVVFHSIYNSVGMRMMHAVTEGLDRLLNKPSSIIHPRLNVHQFIELYKLVLCRDVYACGGVLFTASS